MYNFKSILGKNVRLHRENLNMSQETLGEKIKVSTKSINYIENGRNFANPNTLSALCEEFQCLPAELFKINYISHDDNATEVKENIIRAINSCTKEKLKHIEKYIYTMVIDE